MRRATLLTSLVAAAVLLFTQAVPAGEDIEAISVTWRDFIASVRRGDYQSAYAMFSEQSRQVFPFQAFVAEYGPLSAARETLLLSPSSFSTEVNGDWGEIRFNVVLPLSGQSLRVGAALVKNDETWRLVAARNETRERVEAIARETLRRLTPGLSRPNGQAAIRALVEREVAGSPLARMYDIGVLEGVLCALPRITGLRAFHVDSWGRIRQGRGGGENPGRLLEVPIPGANYAPLPLQREIPALEDVPSPVIAGSASGPGGMPELAEPAFSPMPSMPGELAEPGRLQGGEHGAPLLPPPPELSEPGSL